jgi:hypothetical protein
VWSASRYYHFPHYINIQLTHALGSGQNLQNAVRKIVENSLNSINESIVKRTATESLARAALQTPQDPSTAASVYGNSNGTFQGAYSNAVGTSTDPNPSYITQGASFPYNTGTSAPVPTHPQIGHVYDPQAYSTSEDAGMTPSHAAALAAAASGTTPQRPHSTYPYPDAKNGQQPPYSANEVGPTDWRQWTRTYMQQVGPTGEFLNTANTLMALGGREGGALAGPGQEVAAEVLNMQNTGPSNFQWPGIVFGMGSNGHVNQQ